MYLAPKMYILTLKMCILAPKMDKSVPFEKVQPQWQLLYLFFWECTWAEGKVTVWAGAGPEKICYVGWWSVWWSHSVWSGCNTHTLQSGVKVVN